MFKICGTYSFGMYAWVIRLCSWSPSVKNGSPSRPLFCWLRPAPSWLYLVQGHGALGPCQLPHQTNFWILDRHDGSGRRTSVWRWCCWICQRVQQEPSSACSDVRVRGLHQWTQTGFRSLCPICCQLPVPSRYLGGCFSGHICLQCTAARVACTLFCPQQSTSCSVLLQLRDEARGQHSGMLSRRKASSPLGVGSSSLILTWHSSISQSPSHGMSSLFQQWSGLEEAWCWLLSQIRLSCIYPIPSRQLWLSPWLTGKHLSVMGYLWKTPPVPSHTGLRMSRCGHFRICLVVAKP